MKNKFLNKLVKNYLLEEGDFNKIEDKIEIVSDWISEYLKQRKRITFVCVGSISNIIRGLNHDFQYNFGVQKGTFKIINAGEKYADEMENWKDIGAMFSVASMDLDEMEFDENDMLIAMSSSAETEYINGALSHGKAMGAKTVLLTNNKNVDDLANIVINLPYSENVVGIKSLSATTIIKMILDMILYNSIIKAGRIYNGQAIFMLWNSDRSKAQVIGIVSSACNISYDEAKELLERAEGIAEVACIMHIKNMDVNEAKQYLVDINYNFNNI